MAPSLPAGLRVWMLLAWGCAQLPQNVLASGQCPPEDASQWAQFTTCVSSAFGLGQEQFPPGCLGNSYYLSPMGLLSSQEAAALSGQSRLVDWDGDGDLDDVFADGDRVRYLERVGARLVELDLSQTTLSTRTRVPLNLAPGSNLLGYDWDRDGDADLLIGQPDGRLRYIERQLSGDLHERTGTDNPFDNIDVGNDALPYVLDIDQDGVWDLVVENGSGSYLAFRNTPSPELIGVAAPVQQVGIQQGVSPFVIGWNDLGYFDALLGLEDGSVAAVEVLLDVATNPTSYRVELSRDDYLYSSVSVGAYARPCVVDWDGDGLDDLVVGAADGRVHYYQRLSNDPLAKFVEVLGSANPFANIQTHVHASPQAVDVNGDGLLDLVTGARNGDLLVFLRDANGEIQPQPTSAFFTGVAAGDSGDSWVVYVVDWQAHGVLDVLTLNATQSTLWSAPSASAVYSPLASPVAPVVLGNPEVIGISLFDADGDGDMDAVTGWATGELRLLLRGMCTKQDSCSLRGVCDTRSGQCQCHTGYEANDCSSCSPGFFSNVPKILPQQWECGACPDAKSPNSVCSLRGLCADDHATSRSARDSGASNSSLLYVIGDGSCTCLEPFFGDACQYGQCGPGYELAHVYDPQLDMHMESCSPCPAGKHKTKEGNFPCVDCSDDLPATGNGTGCACPPDTYFLGIFEPNESKCVTCDAQNNVRCPGGSSPPIALFGYYLITYDVAIHCNVMVELNGTKVSACREGSFLDADEDKCAPGHTGPLCGACAAQYARDKGGEECVDCINRLPATPELCLFLVCQLVFMSTWVMFLTKRAIASVMLMRTDAILIRILNQWLAVNSVLAVLDLQEILASGQAFSQDTGSITSSAWTMVCAVVPMMTYCVQLFRVFKTQMFVECIVERSLLSNNEQRDTQIETLVQPLVWWNLFPVFIIVLLAIQLILLVKVLWPLMVRYFPSVGKEAIIKVLKAYGVPAHEAASAADTFSSKEIVKFMGNPSSTMRNPEKLGHRFGLKMLCQVTAHRVREQLHQRMKNTEDPQNSSNPNHRFDPKASDEFTLALQRLAYLAEELRSHHVNSIYEVFQHPEGYLRQMELSSPDAQTKRLQLIEAPDHKEAGNSTIHDMDAALFSGHLERDSAVLGLYGDLSLRTVFMRSMPFFLIAIYNASELTTERFFQTFHARSVDYPDGSRKFLWMSDTRLEIGEGEHMQAFTQSLRGLLVYSIGFPLAVSAMLVLLNKRDKLQTQHVLHNLGYFYNGFEPRKYWWELVKRIDVLLVQIVAYTTICVYARAKLLVYSLFSVIFLSLHYAHRPYDDRQGNLLDGLEGHGLQTRVFTFQLLLMSLLFPFFAPYLIFLILVQAIYFLSFFLASTVVEIASSFQSRVGVTTANMPAFLATAVKWVSMVLNFVGNEREELERSVQHFIWLGPGKPIQIKHVSLPCHKLSVPRRIFRRFIVKIYSLGSENQRESAANQVGQFVDHMLTTMKCQQISPHTFDFIFTLPLALRRIQARGYSLHDIHLRQALQELYHVYIDAEMKGHQPPSPPSPFLASGTRSFMREKSDRSVRSLRSERSGRSHSDKTINGDDSPEWEHFGSTTRDLGRALLYLYRLKHSQAKWLMLHAFRPLRDKGQLLFAAMERSDGADGSLSAVVKSMIHTSCSSLHAPSKHPSAGVISVEEDAGTGSTNLADRRAIDDAARAEKLRTEAIQKLKIYQVELQLLRAELYVTRQRVADREADFLKLEERNRLLRAASVHISDMEYDRRFLLLEETGQSDLGSGGTEPRGIQGMDVRHEGPAGPPTRGPFAWKSALTPSEPFPRANVQA